MYLVGDPVQLPATVLSTRAVEHAYDKSMFQRLQVRRNAVCPDRLLPGAVHANLPELLHAAFAGARQEHVAEAAGAALYTLPSREPRCSCHGARLSDSPGPGVMFRRFVEHAQCLLRMVASVLHIM